MTLVDSMNLDSAETAVPLSLESPLCRVLSAESSLQVAFVYCRLKLPSICRLLAYHSTPINTLAQIWASKHLPQTAYNEIDSSK